MKPNLHFFLALAAARIRDHLQGRALATNDGLLTPMESTGTVSLTPSLSCPPIAFRNCIVRSGNPALGSSDRQFDLANSRTDKPLGIIFNDQVQLGDAGYGVPKAIALFGIYKGTLPGFASAPMPASTPLVIDPAFPGQASPLPTTPGTYYVFGISRFTIAAAGDPVSIIHCVPYQVVVTA